MSEPLPDPPEPDVGRYDLASLDVALDVAELANLGLVQIVGEGPDAQVIMTEAGAAHVRAIDRHVRDSARELQLRRRAARLDAIIAELEGWY